MGRTILSLALVSALGATALAQSDRTSRDDDPQLTDRTEVISRTVKAVNYMHRGETKVDMRGTDRMPDAHGVAEVKSRQGRLNIELSVEHFAKMPWDFGPEFLTYVLWAVTPDGRPQNLGEILNVDHTHLKQNATTDLQSFALIITAEPYYAVTQPSEVVVMENLVRADTKGSVAVVDARYSLLRSGSYTEHVEQGTLTPLINGQRKVPLELLEARNAVRIAEWSQASRYAADSYRNAQDQLNKAQSDQDAHAEKNTVIAEARQATQTAEDARILVAASQTRRAGAQRAARGGRASSASTTSGRPRSSSASASRAADADRAAAGGGRSPTSRAASTAGRTRAAGG